MCIIIITIIINVWGCDRGANASDLRALLCFVFLTDSSH